MPITVKPLDQIVRNWSRDASAAAGEYAVNAAASAGKYGANTGAASATWRAGVSAAGAEQRFANNARGRGQTRYARKIGQVGQSRYAEGVASGGDNFSEGFAPYIQVISGVSLPPRAPRGSAANLARVAAVSNALSARRLGSAAAGR